MDKRTPKDTLELFVRKAEMLTSFSFAENILNDELSISFTPDTMTVNKNGPTDESIAAFTNVLRMFIQPRDGISIDQMAELFESMAISDSLRDSWRRNYSEYEAYLAMPNALNLSLGGDPPLTRKQVFDLVIYGDIVHVNPDKERELQNWAPTPNIRAIFDYAVNDVLYGLLVAVHVVKQLCQKALAEIDNT